MAGTGTVMTLAEWGMRYGSNGKMDPIIELMAKDNYILDDIPFREGNTPEGYKTTIRTGLPTLIWRKLYQGTPPSKSKIAIVTDTCGMMEARSEIDYDLYKFNDKSNVFRMEEAQAFTEAMQQEAARSIFYGDTDAYPEQFMGFDPRYAYKDAPNVIDAGGTGNDNTSIWGVVWGEREVHGIFPKGSKAGLEHDARDKYDAFDADGNRFDAIGDVFKWKIGLTVQDWRCVVRICNIDVSDLAAGNVPLQKLTIEAKNRIPMAKRGRMIWYGNENVLTALEKEAIDKDNVYLRYGEYLDSKEVLKVHGKPIRQCDAILSTEAALTATP